MIQKQRVVQTRGVQDVEKFINDLTQGKTFITNSWSEKRNLDVSNATLDDVANVLATLLNDLKIKGIVQK